MLETMGYGDWGGVESGQKLFRMVWLAALAEAGAEGGVLGPAGTGTVNGTGVLGQGCAGQCWVSAHLPGKKRGVGTEEQNVFKTTVVKEIQGVLVGQAGAGVQWQGGMQETQSLWEDGTV